MGSYARTTVVVSATVFLCVAAIGLTLLYRAHPAEDAFILFKYAENLARGEGIVYYSGGPRTEGATDFLWLVMLAASIAAGVNVALAALFWNALGASLAAGLLAREITRSGAPPPWRHALLVVPLSLPLVAGAPAAYLGFSSLLYQAIVLVVFLAASSEAGGFGVAVPWLGLALTLFRPDGAFFAATFVGVSAIAAFRGQRGRAFTMSTAGAVAVGIAYFVGRWVYFGQALPLPLYVKSHGVLHGPAADLIRRYVPWLKGVGVQLMWLKSSLGPVPAFLAVVFICARRPAGGTRNVARRAVVAAAASAVFLGALSFAFQVQNVHFRYQAPVTILLLFLLASCAARRIAESTSRIDRTVVCAVVLAALLPMVYGGLLAVFAGVTESRSYIDVLPARLAAVMHPRRTIALTDAGRLAYWTDTPTVDVAGLNDARTALHPPSLELLRQIDPDVLLVHPGAAIIGETFPPDADQPAYFPIDRDAIERRIAPAYRAVFDGGLREYDATTNAATVAATVMLRYLAERSDEYTIESVRYQGGYRHVFAFRRSLPEAPAIADALAQSTSGRDYAPYAALEGFPLARRFDAAVDRSAQ